MVQCFVIISTIGLINAKDIHYPVGRFPFLMPNVTPYRVRIFFF